MKPNHNLKKLYKAAYDFMKNEIGQETLEDKLNHYRQYKAETMQDVFWHLVYSLTNKVGMRATIGDIDNLNAHLFCFDPHQTRAHYQDDWETLFKNVKNDYTPPGPMNINNKSSYWVLFCKGILSGAAFLSEFESINAFDEFVNSFTLNDISTAALPILIEQEVYGMGFPLACDFLKEIGYNNYAKPDTHTITILFETGAAKSRDIYEVFKTMVRMARVNKESPAVIDYLLWLIGSGKYVEENEKITRQKAAFIRLIQPKLNHA